MRNWLDKVIEVVFLHAIVNRRSALMALVCFSLVGDSRAVHAEPVVEATPMKLSLSQESDGVTIRVGQQLFTRYLLRSGRRPVLWPVIGPNDKAFTRSFPVSEPQPGEATDHIHHRSVWVGWEGLNEVDFWHEPEADRQRPFELGSVEHRQFLTLQCDGATAEIVAQNDWLDSKKKRVCEDVRTLRFGATADQRWIDFQIVFKASDGPLRIADSKEGLFAIRVASSMKVDAQQGGKFISSEVNVNDAAWGKHAEWVDYSGPIENETVGIAILCHPSSFNAPTAWHVRSYGLFAANPFGKAAFTENPPPVPDRALAKTLNTGETLSFRYRIIFHRGDEKQAQIAQQYAEFSAK